jgi:dihydrofolate synthase / folylpolyglutamate synthase
MEEGQSTPPPGRTAREAWGSSSALAFLETFADVERGAMPPGGLTLDRTREILAALGNPERRYSSVIIAGTNGKGSTAAMVERALRAAGHKTGMYSQPHLHTIRERVRIDGKPISPAAFDRAMEPIRAAIEVICDATRPTTAYEVMTTLALQHFADEAVDVGVLEVGLGGRLDSTNVVDAVVSALTPIGMDHMHILGDTVAAIAAEKADVIKPGRVCASAPQHPDALGVIQGVAQVRGAQLRIAGENGARWDDAPRGWDLITSGGRLASLRPSLRGAYQRTNIAVAATVLDALREAGVAPLPLDAVRQGIEGASWPGRFEVVEGSPPIVIDGAHNENAARALAEALAETYPNRRCVFVLGVFADKDVAAVTSELLERRSENGAASPPPLVVATRADHPRAVDPERIAALARAAGAEVEIAPTVASALDLARARAAADDVIVVAGSLYVVAEAREALGLADPGDHVSFDPWASR